MTRGTRIGGATLAVALPEITPSIVRRYTVRGLRRALGLTQREFAAALGVSRSQVARWEHQRRVPGPPGGDSGPKYRMKQLAKVEAILSVLWPDPHARQEHTRLWMRQPLPVFGGRRPVEVLLSEGPSKIIDELLGDLSGGYA